MLHIDIETWSSIDLKTCGVYRYAESPDFEIMLASWSVDAENVQLAVGEDEIREIPGLWDDGLVKVAHNAQFERVCFSRLAGLPTGEFLPAELWLDTQTLAAENGYPSSLADCARALGADPKDSAGTALINLFCKPYRGRRVFGWERPEKWEEFKRYAIQDTRTLIDVHKRLPDWPVPSEHRAYIADQKVNDRGIKLDIELAKAAEQAAEDNQVAHEVELITLTGVANPGSVQQISAWLKGQGITVQNLKSETVTALLKRDDITAEVRRSLELRKELALVTSKKYSAAIRSTNEDGRLRGAFRFFGAHTGRWSGRGVQLHNLTRASVENTEQAILDLKLGNGADAQTLKGLIRPMLVGPFTVVDYSAIEARVLAWLAGEEWVLEAFRDGRDIYVETAERMGGLSRAEGKIAVLALGYQGGVGSLRAMGGGDLGTDDDLQQLVNQWRRANPNIVKFWGRVASAARHAPRLAGRLKLHRGEIRRGAMDLKMILPSDRSLTYHKVKWDSSDRMSFADPKGYRTDTYGGRLSENATQATARDILAEAIVRLEDRGYEVAGHVHDEILVAGEHPVEDIVKIMCEPPDWAEGLPIAAEGFTCARYEKG